ncbi:MAG TPA: class I SAM-dependent methyltransferase [Prolixibacteraceae bacterium]|nr:class I SAM-dependent methyltransferase [Prolixibacteraceae bacterium]
MTKHFYTSIAKHYQHIFPFNPDHISFLRQVLPYNGAKILDVGCATGDLSFALSHFGFPVWAFDFDAQMIEIAQRTKLDDSMFPVFEQSDMLLVDQHYPESFFNTVICFGNTLVHLLTDDDIRQFIHAAYKVLAPEGKLTIQILNYDFVLEHQIKSLPPIDNEHILFERNYEFNNDSELINFNTKLIIKSTGQEITNSVQLYAIRKNKLQELLEEAGFGALEFFGNFNGDPLQDNSLPLIVTCLK